MTLACSFEAGSLAEQKASIKLGWGQQAPASCCRCLPAGTVEPRVFLGRWIPPHPESQLYVLHRWLRPQAAAALCVCRLCDAAEAGQTLSLHLPVLGCEPQAWLPLTSKEQSLPMPPGHKTSPWALHRPSCFPTCRSLSLPTPPTPTDSLSSRSRGPFSR